MSSLFKIHIVLKINSSPHCALEQPVLRLFSSTDHITHADFLDNCCGSSGVLAEAPPQRHFKKMNQFFILKFVPDNEWVRFQTIFYQ